MKYLVGYNVFVNESIIEWESHNIKDFYKEVYDIISKDFDSKNKKATGVISINDLVSVGQKNNIEIVNYNQFYNDLEDTLKAGAPPKNQPFFATVNEKTKKIRIVLNNEYFENNPWRILDTGFLDKIYHMMKHENVHLGQLSRTAPRKLGGDDVSDMGKYFSNKDEIMAFSQSIADDVMGMNPKDMEDALKKLYYYSRPWQDIKRTVKDHQLINRYKKYIYLYLKEEFKKQSLLPKVKAKARKKYYNKR